MSISKTWVCDPQNIKATLEGYYAADKPTIEALALRLGTTVHNVHHVIRVNVSPERLKAEKALRYSRSKMGSLNPMRGKNGAHHHNFIGDIEDGKGYLQRKVDGEYVFVHRIVMATALGVKTIPVDLVVHHIDENPKNNDLDNLALCTPAGHKRLHAKRSQLQKSPLWVQWVSGTSK